MNNKVLFCKVPCTIDKFDDQIKSIIHWIRETDSAKLITYINHHVFNISQSNFNVKKVLQIADIVSIDSISIVIGILLFNRLLCSRSVMQYLFESMLSKSDIPECNAILIGGNEFDAIRAMQEMNKVSKQIKITNAYNGYQPFKEYIKIIEQENNAKLVLIGMGTPKSEELLLVAKNNFNDKIFWNIGGGTLQCFAGNKRRGPKIINRLGLEWIHRIVFEPHIRSRYYKGIPLYFLNIFKQIKLI